MSDYPERISISPVHKQKRDDDFHLVDRTAFPGKGVEYVRADLAGPQDNAALTARIEVLEAALARISNIKPHELGETPNEYHMRQIARASVAELKGHAEP